MPKARNSILALLAIAIFIQLGGGWCISFVLRRMHKTEIQNRIAHGAQGILLLLTEDEFNAARVDEKEIEIAGVFYDLIEINQYGKFIQVNALPDQKEKILDELQHTERGRNMLLHVAKIFTPAFIIEKPLKLDRLDLELTLVHFENLTLLKSEFHPQIALAPPDDFI